MQINTIAVTQHHPLMPSLRHWIASSPAKNLYAGWLSFLSTSAYGLISLPVAAHYLSMEEIGLWNLASQLVAYLLLVELGLGNAVGRLMADSMNSGDQAAMDRDWSSLLVTLAFQGIFSVMLAWMLCPHIRRFLDIPSNFDHQFDTLWMSLSLLQALSFPLRALTGILLCQERYHLSLAVSACAPLIQLASFSILLGMGFGVESYVIAAWVVAIFQFGWLLKLVAKGANKPRFRIASASWRSVKPALKYSFSMLLWTFSPLVLASIPSVVLSRTLGLEYVTIYMVSMRVPQMFSMLGMRFFHSFYPKIQVLHVSGEKQKFIRYYRLASCLTMMALGFGLVVSIFMNAHVVEWLSNRQFYAGNTATFWFAIGFVILAISELAGTLFVLAGKGRHTSTVLILELTLTVFAAFICAQHFDLVGVAATLALAPLMVRVPYYVFAGPRSCLCSPKELFSPATATAMCTLFLVFTAYLALVPKEGYVSLIKLLLALGITLPLVWMSFRTLFFEFNQLRPNENSQSKVSAHG